MSVEDLKAFYHRCYQPDRVVAVVCGDVQSSRIQELAAHYFGDWRASNGGSAQPDAPVYQPLVGSLSHRLSLEVPIATRIHRTDPLAEIDKPALDLLVALLGSGTSSPIRQALVRKRRLCVEAGCVSMIGARGGILVFFGAFLPPGRHAPRQTVIRELTDQLAASGPDPEQFARHLKKYRKSRARDGYSCHRHMMGLGNAELLEGGYENYERGLEALSRVTPERIRELARTLFAPQNTLELNITPENTRWWMLPVGLFTRIWPR